MIDHDNSNQRSILMKLPVLCLALVFAIGCSGGEPGKKGPGDQAAKPGQGNDAPPKAKEDCFQFVGE